jgi:hypothetical protein
VAAVTIRVGSRVILVVSVSVAAKSSANDSGLPGILGEVEEIIVGMRHDSTSPIKLVVAGGFNRHDQL